MKIVHISPNAIYNDNFGYQENILPKYHRKMGHEVTLIVNTREFTKNGFEEIDECDYCLEDGVRIIRKKNKKYPFPKITPLIMRLPAYSYLCEIEPEFIFFHGLCSRTMDDCIRYKKRMRKRGKQILIVADNHLDYNIGMKDKTFKQKVLRLYYRMYNKKAQRYLERVYGVTPWRKQYAEEYFHISEDKTDVLVMGADDDKIDLKRKVQIRNEIRTLHGIGEEDFLVLTGGKIDLRKKIHLLMEGSLQIPKLKLIIFGKIEKDIENKIHDLLDKSNNFIYIGWIPADKVYDYFFAADLVVFPGQHSVLWEQACASKVPCIFAKWPGMDHVNNGGNAMFFEDITTDEIRRQLIEVMWTEKYYKMKEKAESDATDMFLYSSIAKKSLESILNRNDIE